MQIILVVLLALIVVSIAVNYKKFVLGLAVLRKFYHEVLMEMKRVAWPSKDEVMGSTIIVGITTFMLLIVIAAVDSMFGRVVLTIFSSK